METALRNRPLNSTYRRFQPLQLPVKLALEPGPNVGLYHERHPRPEWQHGLSRALHDLEDLIPFALDLGEH